MNFDLKKIASGLILSIGLIFFLLSISKNNLNFALISLTVTLIFWVLYGLLLDAFDVRIFAWIISASGFLLSLAILFMFGIEEVPYPIGAIVFHSGGFAGALGIGLFSFFPILILHHLETSTESEKAKIENKFSKEEPDPKILGDEWEIASKDELQSGGFDIG